jgi:hypothetical protein
MRLKENIYKIGLAYICRHQQEINISRACEVIRERYNGIERQNLFSNISENMS